MIIGYRHYVAFVQHLGKRLNQEDKNSQYNLNAQFFNLSTLLLIMTVALCILTFWAQITWLTAISFTLILIESWVRKNADQYRPLGNETPLRRGLFQEFISFNAAEV